VTPAPLRADAARNRERVLAAARETAAGGDLALPLNEIARRAGVGVGTVYRHFPDRRALLEALVDEQLDRLLERARRAAALPDPGDGVAELVRGAVELEMSQPGFVEVLAPNADAGPATAAKLAELGGTAEELLERARAAGSIRPDLGAGDVQRLICGAGYAARLGPGDADARARRYVELIIAGMRP